MGLFRSRVAAALFLCATVIIGGTVGFMLIEDYTVAEGLYMSAITMSTVGFGEVKPLSEIGRIFTTGLIVMSFLSLAFTGHTLGQSLLEKVWSGQAERKKMQKKIETLKNHYVICGFGRVGASAASYFDELKVDFVVIETNEASRVLLADKGYCYIEGDATHEDVLEAAGIKTAKGLLALLNSDPDNLFVVLSARELNPTLHIISRVGENSANSKILRAGADKVISPYASTGKRIATDILMATGQVAYNNGDEQAVAMLPRWITVGEGSSMIGSSVCELSHRMRRQVLGVRRDDNDQLMPHGDLILVCDDQILVLDEDAEDDADLQINVAPRRIVIIDDNPVIIKLYTRLFQKAGFVPKTATNGREGLDLILYEKPDAAVIDYQLPLMSGIDICGKVRQQWGPNEIKLILFTVDNSASRVMNYHSHGHSACR